ncbi:hypothetical protein CE91St1_51550 [Parabacteroides goldsteinii]|nr:hypothetical protein CE91St1_51550 [Parabacteroides goldsteinii]GKG80580.1 hypothetical protein CE91St2_37720 [Parabacteroides goldsteinii]
MTCIVNTIDPFVNYVKELIEDGWFSASEFFEEVYSTVVVLAEELNKE